MKPITAKAAAREEVIHGGPIIRRNLGRVLAVGGVPVR